jgi:small subunit ribosomal protein S3Ae
MAKARARTQSRRVKDKWKSKQWYTVEAPPMFNKATVAETLADDAGKLIGRVVTTTLQDLSGDFKQMHIKLNFQVEEVNGTAAASRFVGHTLTSDYVRRMVRRNHSKVSTIVDVKTKDGATLRVKPFAVSERRSQGSQQSEIRRIMTSTITTMAAERTLAGFVRDVIDGTVSANIYKGCKKVYPLRRIEIGKTEVRSAPSITVDDDVKAWTEPQPEPEAPEGEEAEESSEAKPEEAAAEGEETPAEAADEEAGTTEAEEPQAVAEADEGTDEHETADPADKPAEEEEKTATS